jgi:hypothetical protein
MVSLSKDCESPCVTQKGGDQNGVTGPRDPSKVSTHESSRVLHSEREPSFPLFVQKSGTRLYLEVIGKPPAVEPLFFFVVPCYAASSTS